MKDLRIKQMITDDIPDVLMLGYQVCDHTDNILMDKTDFIQVQTAEWMKSSIKNGMITGVVGKVGAYVLGFAYVLRGQHTKNRHVGTITLMVHPHYWGRGAGNKLIEGLLEAARCKTYIVECFETNDAVIAMCNRHGFRRYGIVPGYAWVDDKPVSNLIFAKIKNDG